MIALLVLPTLAMLACLVIGVLVIARFKPKKGY